MFNANYYDTTTPCFLAISPEYASVRKPDAVNGSANMLEADGYWEVAKGAHQYRRNIMPESRELSGAWRALGIKKYETGAHEGMCDLHFTADQSISRTLAIPGVDGKPTTYDVVTVLSKFTNTERQPEVEVIAKFFREQFPERKLVEATVNCEGTGDAILDVFRGLIWAGHAPGVPSRHTAALGRSDIRAHKMYEDIMGLEVISLPMRWPFYHVDIATAFLSRGHIMCHEGGLQPQGVRKLKHEAFRRYGLPENEYLIRVSREDALKGACNIRCVANTVIMVKGCSQELYASIKSKGYEIIQVSMVYYGVAGGYGHCGSNHFNEVVSPGGYAARIGIERQENLIVSPDEAKRPVQISKSGRIFSMSHAAAA